MEFHRRGKVVTVAVKGRIMFSELATKLAAYASGLGIAQTIEFGVEPAARARRACAGVTRLG